LLQQKEDPEHSSTPAQADKATESHVERVAWDMVLLEGLNAYMAKWWAYYHEVEFNHWISCFGLCWVVDVYFFGVLFVVTRMLAYTQLQIKDLQ
jgi:hypothetical protein